MTLDDAEKLAGYISSVEGFVPSMNAAVDLVSLANAVLAMLPVCRAAAAWRTAHGLGPTWEARAALNDAIDQLHSHTKASR